ncbi:hypothetical protein M433DRAFT_516166 [Acidomyces richmondensis BFW]|nr:hypothetical protein M433DRAFT_516166 [Acidomyces richmondensis BFW]
MIHRLACSASELPATFYRVQYDGCSTLRCDDGSFLAADTTTVYQDKDLTAFAQSVINQFIRRDRAPTPWITVFADREHAIHFASQTNGPVRIYVVDTSRLRGTRVFQIATLVRAFELNIPDGATEHATHGYLILHRIPAEAVGEMEYVESSKSVPARGRVNGVDSIESIDINESDNESVCEDDLIAILDRTKAKDGIKMLSLSGQCVEC